MYNVPKLTDYSAAALEKAANDLLRALDEESESVHNKTDYKVFRDRWTARKDGVLTQLNNLWLKAAPRAAKPDVGQRVNMIKGAVEEAIEIVEGELIAQVERALDGGVRGV